MGLRNELDTAIAATLKAEPVALDAMTSGPVHLSPPLAAAFEAVLASRAALLAAAAMWDVLTAGER